MRAAGLLLRDPARVDAAIDAALENMLQPQVPYVARIHAAIGYVNAATGDLRTVQYPYGVATQWSRVFQISNP